MTRVETLKCDALKCYARDCYIYLTIYKLKQDTCYCRIEKKPQTFKAIAIMKSDEHCNI